MLIGGPSFWLHQLGPIAPRPALPASVDCDVAIVGAGYTGLWTAYYLKRADPGLRVVVVEREFAGYGASGRNGGWVAGTVAGYHDERTAAAIRATVDEVGRVCAHEGITCDYVKSGGLAVATSDTQLARLRSHPLASEAIWLEPDDLAQRMDVPGALGAVYDANVARVHPARLARGLAEVVEGLGVTIHERTLATAIEPKRVRTARGDVRADWVVRATEGYTPSLPGVERRLIPLRSTMIVTEPLDDDAWDAIGWRGDELVADAALSYIYAQRTADGRIAIGGRGRPYLWRSGHDRAGEVEQWAVARLIERLHELWPASRDAGIAHAWSGVFGAQRDWAMTVAADPATGLAWAGGYVGEGVAASNLAGRVLADRIRGVSSDLTTLPMVDRREPRDWEPEPLRFVGSHAVYGLIEAADRRERRTGRSSRLYDLAKAISGRHAE